MSPDWKANRMERLGLKPTRGSSWAPYLFMMPFFLTFAVFQAYPLAKSLWLTLHQTYGPEFTTYVGFNNFIFMFKDPSFWRALRNTTVFAVCSLCLQLPLALGLAMLLDSKILRGKEFFRLAFFSPHLVGQVFVAVLFQILYSPRFGLVNQLLFKAFGTDPDIKWLNQVNLVMPAIVITSIWMYVGFNMVYFLAALQTVDKQLYEAAEIDGAGAWDRFLHITIPGIRPVAAFVIVFSTIGSYRLFELPYLLLNQNSGPQESGLTLVMYLYQTGFNTGDLGYASAIGWILVLITFVLSLVQSRFTGGMKANS